MGRWKIWADLAGGEGVQFAEALGEFGGGYAALAAEGAEKILGGGFSFLGVALGAARNKIAVGILSSAGLWDDMVEAARARGKLGQAVETEAAIAGMNGRAARFREQEVRLLDAGGARPTGEARGHRSIGFKCDAGFNAAPFCEGKRKRAKLSRDNFAHGYDTTLEAVGKYYF